MGVWLCVYVRGLKQESDSRKVTHLKFISNNDVCVIIYWPWSYFFRIKLFAGTFSRGSLRKPQKLEPPKGKRSDTAFWPQNPEGLSHAERDIFSLRFPCWKNIESRVGGILFDFMVSKFCCVFWGNWSSSWTKTHIDVINRWDVLTVDQGKVYSTKLPLNFFPGF